jgi:hypothetical protein
MQKSPRFPIPYGDYPIFSGVVPGGCYCTLTLTCLFAMHPPEMNSKYASAGKEQNEQQKTGRILQ